MTGVLEGAAGGLITNLVTDLVGSFKKKCRSIEGKQKRLQMELILFHSVIDLTKDRTIQNPSLKCWLNELMEAVLKGERTLEGVKRQIILESSVQEDSSVLSQIVSVASSAKEFFTGGAFIKELDCALEELEIAGRNLNVYVKLIALEVSFAHASFVNMVTETVSKRLEVASICEEIRGKSPSGIFHEGIGYGKEIKNDFANKEVYRNGDFTHNLVEEESAFFSKEGRGNSFGGVGVENKMMTLSDDSEAFLRDPAGFRYPYGGFTRNTTKRKYPFVSEDGRGNSYDGIPYQGFGHGGKNKKMKLGGGFYDFEASIDDRYGIWHEDVDHDGKNTKMKFLEESENCFYENCFYDLGLGKSHPGIWSGGIAHGGKNKKMKLLEESENCCYDLGLHNSFGEGFSWDNFVLNDNRLAEDGESNIPTKQTRRKNQMVER